MTAELRKFLSLGVLAVIAGVLIVTYVPPLAFQQPLTLDPAPGESGQRNDYPVNQGLLEGDAALTPTGASGVALIVLVPLSLGLASYVIVKKLT